MVLYLTPDDAGRDGGGKTPHPTASQTPEHLRLTQNARERTVDTPQQNGTETLSIHVDFTADSSPDPELSTYV